MTGFTHCWNRWVRLSIWTGLFWVSRRGVGGVGGGAFTDRRSDLRQERAAGLAGLRGLQKTSLLLRFGLEFPSSPPTSVPSRRLQRHRHLQLWRAGRLSQWHGTTSNPSWAWWSPAWSDAPVSALVCRRTWVTWWSERLEFTWRLSDTRTQRPGESDLHQQVLMTVTRLTLLCPTERRERWTAAVTSWWRSTNHRTEITSTCRGNWYDAH